jgi:IS4 transposase
MFPWAKFRKTKSAIKLHTLIDINCSIPTCIIITDGKVGDVNILDQIMFEPGAFYIMDRGYCDFERLFAIHQRKSYFVTRAKKNLGFTRVYSHQLTENPDIKCDQTIRFKSNISSSRYPEKLRRIKVYDRENSKYIVILTNNFDLSPTVIAELYRNRWKIELFFKWIKQHLRIKSFFGTSVNAVKTQIWIAVCVYVMIAILKKELKIKENLYTILQVLSLSLFEKMPMNTMFSKNDYEINSCLNSNLLTLFD